MNNIQYKGARWFKCDLHLHTPVSQCFLDQQVTPSEWVQACIDAGLNCVAVTDHNTGAWIDQIKEAAKGKDLVIFPGVEITCDTSKIHLLLLFDTEKTSQDIEDFLIACGITRPMFAAAEAHSPKTVVDIAKMANDAGALVIPAHIDEFNGLAYEASKASLKEFVKMPFIHAVQFVHPEYLDSNLQVINNQDLLQTINNYYGKTTPVIGENDIKNGYDGIKIAKQAGMRLLTFSDNPDSTTPSKHGLFGIGTRYSWVKMDGNPTLEGLRQAFMMPERTCNCFESESVPYKLPDLWIKSINFKNTTLTRNNSLFQVQFNPQLTTIIGGRGSGKSSILRFLRGVFGKEKDLEDLDEVLEDYQQFFKKVDEEGKGVLKEDTRIEVVIVRNGLEYRVVWEYGQQYNPIVERLNVANGQYEPIEDEAYLDFFVFEEYSQKQIFSIAQKPNSLRARIDSAIPDMIDIKAEYNQARQDYRELKTKQRSLRQAVQAKGKLLTEIKDLQSKIELLKRTGISGLISQQQKYDQQKKYLNTYLQSYGQLKEKINELIPSFKSFESFNADVIEDKYRDEVVREVKTLSESVPQIEQALKIQTTKMTDTLYLVFEHLKESSLIKESAASKAQFEKSKKQLEEKGITDMSDFQKYSKQIEEKNKELLTIAEKETELISINEKIREKYDLIKQKRVLISQKREEFVNAHVNSNNIHILVHPYMDKNDWEMKLRRISQKQSGYDRGVDAALENVYGSSDISNGIESFKVSMRQLHDGTLQNNPYDGWYTRMIQELTQSQMDEIDMLYPEDEIEMQYVGRDGTLRSIAVASAGQKTTAILSFILSFGKTPLILDQPEDDLDNRLVSQLIVEKIRDIKNMRQVIVVTHNANIPVNGDAEYVVSMASDTPTLKIQAQGTVENDQVKKEICEVMEGGVDAFNTRAERYASLNKR